MTLSEWGAVGEVFQALIGFALLVVAIWAARVAVEQLRTSAAQTRVSGTTALADRFNDPTARDRRRWIYHHCRELIDPEQVSKWEQQPENLNFLENICNSLDLTALLVYNGLVNKDDAIELYGDSIIRCWVVLRRWVEHTRDTRNSKRFLWKKFEWLADNAIVDERFEDWRENGVKVYTQSERITLDYKTSEIRGVEPIV